MTRTLRRWRSFLIVGALLLAFPLACGAVEPNASSGVAHIDAVIDRLAAPKFLEREIATKELLQRGSAVIPSLETALHRAKGETRYRIRMILDRQRASSDATTRHAAQNALARIAVSKDRPSAAWAQSLLRLPTGIVPALLEFPPST